MIKVEILKKADNKILKDLNHLISQLSLSPVPPKPINLAYLKQMISQKDFYILVVRNKDFIIASLVVYITKLPTGRIAEADDLVVDEPYRSLGLGKVLMDKAIEIAKKNKAKHISHRSNPKRLDANKLYIAMGFKKLDTNFYRINLNY